MKECVLMCLITYCMYHTTYSVSQWDCEGYFYYSSDVEQGCCTMSGRINSDENSPNMDLKGEICTALT